MGEVYRTPYPQLEYEALGMCYEPTDLDRLIELIKRNNLTLRSNLLPIFDLLFPDSDIKRKKVHRLYRKILGVCKNIVTYELDFDDADDEHNAAIFIFNKLYPELVHQLRIKLRSRLWNLIKPLRGVFKERRMIERILQSYQLAQTDGATIKALNLCIVFYLNKTGLRLYNFNDNGRITFRVEDTAFAKPSPTCKRMI